MWSNAYLWGYAYIIDGCFINLYNVNECTLNYESFVYARTRIMRTCIMRIRNCGMRIFARMFITFMCTASYISSVLNVSVILYYASVYFA